MKTLKKFSLPEVLKSKRSFIYFIIIFLSICIIGCGDDDDDSGTVTNNDNDDIVWDDINDGSDEPNYENDDILGTWTSSTVDGVPNTDRTFTFSANGTATSNCGGTSSYTWSPSDGDYTIDLTSSGDPEYCSTDNCTVLILDTTGLALTSICDRTTVFTKSTEE